MKHVKTVMGAAAGACALLGLTAPASAQAARATPIQVEAGDAFILDMSITVDNPALMGVQVDLGLGLEVEEMGPRGGVWRWSIESLALVPSAALSEPGTEYTPMAAMPYGEGLNQALGAGLRLMSDLDFVCRVDAQGVCVEVLNWPEWRERVENTVLFTTGMMVSAEESQRRSMERIAAYVEEAPVAVEPAAPAASAYKPDYVPSYRRQPGPLYPAAPEVYAPEYDEEYYEPEYTPVAYTQTARNIEAVAGVILDSLDGRLVANMLSFPAMTDVQGLTLAPGATAPTERLYALPFGATPLRVSGSVTLDSVDRAEGVARFSRTATLDWDGAKRSIRELMQNATPPIMAAIEPTGEGQSGGVTPEQAALASSMLAEMVATLTVELRETSTAEVDLATGLIRSGQMQQSFTLILPSGTPTNLDATITFSLRPASLGQPRLGVGS